MADDPAHIYKQNHVSLDPLNPLLPLDANGSPISEQAKLAQIQLRFKYHEDKKMKREMAKNAASTLTND